MTREEFRQLAESKVILLDGATGTNLQKSGMPSGICPEQWILDNPDVLFALQKAYLEAGADILYAPTFSANRIKLEEYGLQGLIKEMNLALVKLSRKAVDESGHGYVAGDLTMTGRQLYPVGSMTFEELVDVYKEQASYMIDAGVDLFAVETMMSLNECRAALLAIREICDLPVMVTLTFKEDGKTFYGTDARTAMVVLEHMGADAVGLNCSTGPDQMRDLVCSMKEYATVPIIAKPNAGLPVLKNGATVFDMDANTFAKETSILMDLGVGILGGCCGTDPSYIRALFQKTQGKKPSLIQTCKKRVLSTERRILPIDLDGSFLIIGERINPTGKKELQAQLKENRFDLVAKMAAGQEKNGASILDINVGMNGIDEKETMKEVMQEVIRNTNLPLCIDSSHVEVIEAALRLYPGRALINSISLEKEKFEKLISLAKKYGAMFILLPLSDKGLPKNIEEKKQIIQTILNEALNQGLTKEDIIVDGLVNTVGANPFAAKETLETIRYCYEELKVATTVGLSNISFGLPERPFVNSTFLALAIQAGLTMAIANPDQDLLVNTAFAADLLLAKDGADVLYIENVRKSRITIANRSDDAKELLDQQVLTMQNDNSLLYEDVVKGHRKKIIEDVKQVLEAGSEAADIVDQMLIPAINKVGEYFDDGTYFLPQLIASAETMKLAIDYLEPLLQKDPNAKKLATIIIATVAGDIHDIGKNLVALMLKNHGYEVIDLGKDVPAETIIRKAKEKQADIIALSALMTTTMLEMKHVIDLVKEENLKVKVMIGGAVITESYAKEIGADGYSKDAGEAVRLVERILKDRR